MRVGACPGTGGTPGGAMAPEEAGAGGGPRGAGGGARGPGGVAGRGTAFPVPRPVPRVSRDSYVPSVSMNPCPLTSRVAASVQPSI
ncbi:hypothetical protein GCM10010272_57560 [Streptomyces lateritius]|nr:hypothetical protein GCM10010272_57560 [Streptomyces lateritius]